MSVSRNAAYNAIGAALPSVLTLVTVPLYLEVVGLERYGILTLCWVILGYSGFLDVGLGLAVARSVAASQASKVDPSPTFWTAAWISLFTGLTGAALIYFGASFYFGGAAEVTPGLRNEVRESIPFLALIVPVAMFGGVCGGALQGRERFLTINALGAVGQTLVAILPLVFAYFWTPSLIALLAGTLLARALPLPLVWLFAWRAVPLSAPMGFSVATAKNLLSFGGWISLTVVANALIGTVDRLLIGSRIAAAAVPAYAIPYGLVSRIIIIPHSLSAALFPRFAYASERERRQFTSSSIQAVAVIITPAIIGLVAIAEPFFRLWIGAELAITATPLSYVLAGGFWMYCITHMAYTMLQATGRPDLVSKILIAELLPYCAVLVAGMWFFGVIGAAYAFTLRAAFDGMVFMYAAKVPLKMLQRLALPGALTLLSIMAASGLEGGFKYSALGALMLASIVWSSLNIPDVLRPYIQRISALLPKRQPQPDGSN